MCNMPMRSVDQLVKMFYENIAHITWPQTTIIPKNVFSIDNMKAIVNELCFYYTIYYMNQALHSWLYGSSIRFSAFCSFSNAHMLGRPSIPFSLTQELFSNLETIFLSSFSMTQTFTYWTSIRLLCDHSIPCQTPRTR